MLMLVMLEVIYLRFSQYSSYKPALRNAEMNPSFITSTSNTGFQQIVKLFETFCIAIEERIFMESLRLSN